MTKHKLKMDAAIGVPLKKTYEIDLSKPLRTFIQNTFTGAKPEDYNSALNEINQLRDQVLLREPDKHESALEKLYR